MALYRLTQAGRIVCSDNMKSCLDQILFCKLFIDPWTQEGACQLPASELAETVLEAAHDPGLGLHASDLNQSVSV